ncbi:MAG: hypothetical protein EA425_14280 [Puniceicoccaceae bacterium]|nr:MAG: hypothetical protein EA425_14280 [Puniceicoccaceae bacterium]
MLRKVCAELQARLAIGPEFHLLKFHLDSPKISFLSYPDFYHRAADRHDPLLEFSPSLASAAGSGAATRRKTRDTVCRRGRVRFQAGPAACAGLAATRVRFSSCCPG